MAGKQQERTAHISPDLDDPRRSYASVQGRTRVLEAATHDTVEEAVAWARERCDVVFVRTAEDDVVRSAGRRRPDAEPDMPTWPPAVELHLEPEDGPPPRALDLTAVVETLAVIDAVIDRLEAAGLTARNRYIDDADRARLERNLRRTGGDHGWTLALGLAVTVAVDVADPATAEHAAAIARAAAEEHGWRITNAREVRR